MIPSQAKKEKKKKKKIERERETECPTALATKDVKKTPVLHIQTLFYLFYYLIFHFITYLDSIFTYIKIK